MDELKMKDSYAAKQKKRNTVTSVPNLRADTFMTNAERVEESIKRRNFWK